MRRQREQTENTGKRCAFQLPSSLTHESPWTEKGPAKPLQLLESWVPQSHPVSAKEPRTRCRDVYLLVGWSSLENSIWTLRLVLFVFFRRHKCFIIFLISGSRSWRYPPRFLGRPPKPISARKSILNRIVESPSAHLREGRNRRSVSVCLSHSRTARCSSKRVG